MKKLFVLTIIAFALSLCAAPQKAVITAGVLNVRVKPSVKSDTILQVKKGDEVIVIEKGDEWSAIRPPENSSLYVSSPLIANGKLKSNGNLRAGSGVNFQSLCILPEGTAVTVLEDKNSWSRIAVPSVDVRCYVATRYLKFIETPAAPAVKPAAPKVQPQNKDDVVSFGVEAPEKLVKLYVAGTEKRVSLSGKLAMRSSKDFGKSCVLVCDGKVYHLQGVIPAAIKVDKPVTVNGISRMIMEWKSPIVEIENIIQK